MIQSRSGLQLAISICHRVSTIHFPLNRYLFWIQFKKTGYNKIQFIQKISLRLKLTHQKSFSDLFGVQSKLNDDSTDTCYVMNNFAQMDGPIMFSLRWWRWSHPLTIRLDVVQPGFHSRSELWICVLLSDRIKLDSLYNLFVSLSNTYKVRK